MNFEVKSFKTGLDYLNSKEQQGADMSSVHWRDATNIRLYKNSGIIPMAGNVNINQGTQFTSYIQGINGFKVGVNSYLVMVTNGNLYSFDGLQFNLIQGGLNTTEKCTFTQYGQGIIVSDGETEPFIYFPERIETPLGRVTTTGTSKIVNGTGFESTNIVNVGDQIIINGETQIVYSVISDTQFTTRDIFIKSYNGTNAKLTNISYLNCNKIYLEFNEDGTVNTNGRMVTLRSKVIGAWNGRVFIGTPKGYFWSAEGSYADWQSQNNAGWSYDIGKPIMSIQKYRGSLALYHGVLSGVSIVNGSGSYDPASWSVAVDYGSIDKGCSSPWGVLNNSLQQYFTDIGIYELTLNPFGTTILGEELSKQLEDRQLGFLQGQLDTTRLNEAITIYNVQKKEIWFYIPIQGESEFNTCYIYDLYNQCWFKRVIPQNVTCATTFNDTIYIGTDDGLILSDDYGVDFNGTPIDWSISTQFFNFGSEREFEIDEFNIIYDKEVTNNFSFSVGINYNEELLDTYTVIDESLPCLIWDTEEDETPSSYNLWSGNGGLVTDDPLSLLDTPTGFMDNNPDCSVENWGHWSIIKDEISPQQLYGSNHSVSMIFSGNGSQQMGIMALEFRNISIDQ